MNNFRIQYIEFTQTGKDADLWCDIEWIVVVDQKTGIAYSGYPSYMLPLGFQILRTEVEEYLAEQEGDPERFSLAWDYWPHEKSL